MRTMTAVVLLLASLAGCAGRSPAALNPADDRSNATDKRADAGSSSGRELILDAVTETLAAHYVADGSTAEQVRDLLANRRTELLAATDADRFYAALNEALDSAGQDHLYLYRPGRDLYDRNREENLLVGATLRNIDGYSFVDDVWEGGPADQAGLLYGDELLPVNGQPAVLDPLPPGPETLRLWVRRQRETEPFFLDVTAARGDTNWYLAESTRASLTHVKQGSCRIGRIHLRTFADEVLIQELTTGASFNDSDALIIDLRGNRGGEVRLAGEVLDLLSREPSVWIRYRNRPYPFPATSWNIPLAILVDGTTRSAAEIFAAAVQTRRLGTLVGSTTAGQVQGSRLFPLPDGSHLLVPVSQVTLADGRTLEGRGVDPDIHSQRPLMYAAGEDPPLEQALEILQGQLACPEELPEETFPHEALSPGLTGSAGGDRPPVP